MEGRPPAETDLVERAKRGDVGAYEQIVRAHQGIAFRTAYLIAGDATDAEDATQEAFVKAFRALGRFRSGAPFRPWLLEIVSNEARNRRRSAGRRTRLALRTQAELGASGGAAPSPEATLLDAERRELLVGAVNELREEERLVIACRYFLDLSEEETAATLGIRRGTVKSRTSRALEHLRAVVEVAA